MIRFDAVGYRYPDAAISAVDHVDLEIAAGDLHLVVGETGSGKSTLLRVIPRLVPHHSGGTFSGTVHVDTRDVTRAAPRELAGIVGFVPQDPEAHGTTDRVEPELAFALENLGTPVDTMRKRLEEVMDQLAIAHLRDRRLDTLSGGERQRVAIAAVLSTQPQVLVCDEPTSALDPRSAEDVIAALVRLRDELGLTVVCSEHRIERLAGSCDRVTFLGHRTGHPRDVFADAPYAPPVVRLGAAFGWDPLPLTVREARRFAASLDVTPPARPSLPHTEPVAGCHDLHVTLGDTSVFDGLTLDLRPGRVTALVGRNGSGKTTVLRTLAGLIRPGAGRVWVPGTDDPSSAEAHRRVAYVPQRAEMLLFRDTVRAELDASGDAARWADRCGLTGLLDTAPWSLSAGQRLWAALATAFARRPDVYLLDEPTRGLDAPGKARLVSILRDEAERGAAVLLVTHDVELVAAVADEVVMLGAGRVVASGPTADVLGESLLFSSQTAKVMGDPRFLTPEDVIAS